MQSSAIALEDVVKRFDDGAPVLDGVCLTVAPREFLTIIGASGSGKTTLLRMINRLLDPTAGHIFVGGKETAAQDATALRRSIGDVFQDVGLFPHMTVAENIAITPRLIGWTADRISARVSELLVLVQLGDDYTDRYPHQMSGGQRQRVGLARAIAASPDVVLMDEHFAALDPLTREALGRDYRRLHDELGITTVMITHDVLEALTLADRIIVLSGGRVVADDKPRDIIDNAHPYVAELMQAPRRHAQKIGQLFGSSESA
jgi:osmoprotectant transport system ATP-binding protein